MAGRGKAEAGGKGDTGPAPFIVELIDIIEHGDQTLVHWAPGAASFIITDPDRFSRDVLEQRFKSSNFASFVRQLNFYGFRKSNKNKDRSVMEFQHHLFQRSRPDLIAQIRRKTAQDYSQKSELDTLRGEVDDLRDVNATLRGVIAELTDAYEGAKRTLAAHGLPAPQYAAPVADALQRGPAGANSRKRMRLDSTADDTVMEGAAADQGQDSDDDGGASDGEDNAANPASALSATEAISPLALEPQPANVTQRSDRNTRQAGESEQDEARLLQRVAASPVTVVTAEVRHMTRSAASSGAAGRHAQQLPGGASPASNTLPSKAALVAEQTPRPDGGNHVSTKKEVAAADLAAMLPANFDLPLLKRLIEAATAKSGGSGSSVNPVGGRGSVDSRRSRRARPVGRGVVFGQNSTESHNRMDLMMTGDAQLQAPLERSSAGQAAMDEDMSFDAAGTPREAGSLSSSHRAGRHGPQRFRSAALLPISPTAAASFTASAGETGLVSPMAAAPSAASTAAPVYGTGSAAALAALDGVPPELRLPPNLFDDLLFQDDLSNLTLGGAGRDTDSDDYVFREADGGAGLPPPKIRAPGTARAATRLRPSKLGQHATVPLARNDSFPAFGLTPVHGLGNVTSSDLPALARTPTAESFLGSMGQPSIAPVAGAHSMNSTQLVLPHVNSFGTLLSGDDASNAGAVSGEHDALPTGTQAGAAFTSVELGSSPPIARQPSFDLGVAPAGPRSRTMSSTTDDSEQWRNWLDDSLSASVDVAIPREAAVQATASGPTAVVAPAAMLSPESAVQLGLGLPSAVGSTDASTSSQEPHQLNSLMLPPEAIMRLQRQLLHLSPADQASLVYRMAARSLETTGVAASQTPAPLPDLSTATESVARQPYARQLFSAAVETAQSLAADGLEQPQAVPSPPPEEATLLRHFVDTFPPEMVAACFLPLPQVQTVWAHIGLLAVTATAATATATAAALAIQQHQQQRQAVAQASSQSQALHAAVAASQPAKLMIAAQAAAQQNAYPGRSSRKMASAVA